MIREAASIEMQQPLDSDRYRQVRRAGRVSVGLNVVLTIAQLIVGWLANAQSLMADALHTLSDMLSDCLVLWANRVGSDPADTNHPYGHRRIETAASLALGVGLTIVGVGILFAAVARIRMVESLPQIGQIAFWMALFTLVAKEWLYRFALRIARRTRSSLLMANAWHARSDAASSLVVAVGIGGSLAGFRWLDPLAAAIVGFMIVRIGFKFAFEALRELVDTGLSEQDLAGIRQTLCQTPGVMGLHDLRTRRMAYQVLVDAHIRVGSRISVSEGHRIAEDVRLRALQAHPDVMDVLVHVDAEEDHAQASRVDWPTRDVLLAHLKEVLGDGAAPIERTIFHYLHNQVEVEVFLPMEVCLDTQRLALIEQRIQQVLPADAYFSAISINCCVAPK